MTEEDDFTPLPKYEDGEVKLFCSFCGKDKRSVELLIAGPSAMICSECVGVCQEVIDEHRATPKD